MSEAEEFINNQDVEGIYQEHLEDKEEPMQDKIRVILQKNITADTNIKQVEKPVDIYISGIDQATTEIEALIKEAESKAVSSYLAEKFKRSQL